MKINMDFVQPTFDKEEPSDAHLQWNRSMCPYCGVGCGLLVGQAGNEIKKVKGDPQHPANLGMICAKGGTLAEMMKAPGRALFPLSRENRGEPLARVTWDAALDRITEKIRSTVREHGPDSFAFYISGQLLSEDYYVINKFAKGFLGTNNVDSNSRLCMASAVVGYTTSLGSDGPPCSYSDIELADCIVITGANMAECHPVLYQRIRQHKQKNPKTRIIVIDPRRTLTCEIADLHLPLLPGGDVALTNGLLRLLIENGRIDRDFIGRHTTGWEETERDILKDSPQILANQAGVSLSALAQAAEWIGASKGFLSFWTMGLNQSSHATAKIQSLINLHLATGRIGVPGSGPFSLTGQPNAMGGRETGGLSTLLPGYRRIADPAARAAMEKLWKVPAGRIAADNGHHAVELFDALEQGKVKVVWVIATNPMVSMPRLDRIRKALAKAELVIVQDAYHPTETSEAAHVVLPAAQWAERQGTVTNSERRVSLLRQVVEPAGEARPDWQIVRDVAARLGYAKDFDFKTSEDVFMEYRETTRGTRVDISGLTYQRLKMGPVQWPFPEEDSPVSKRLYEDRKFAHADGRARFVFNPYRDAAEIVDPKYPLILITGRIRDQWHTMTRTGKIQQLLKSQSEAFLDMHPEDLKEYALRDGELVWVTSRRGSFRIKLKRKEDIRRGTLFAPMHWGSLFGTASVNDSVNDAFDPLSKQPELKYSAVRVTRDLAVC
jgi:assimilatory nitrate reductase catalytic subunit